MERDDSGHRRSSCLIGMNYALIADVEAKQISSELGCDRTTAWRHRQLALTKIAARLNAE